MLQNGYDSLEEDWSSFCSSCKSDLRSFLSISVPSYLNESISSISSNLQNASQSQLLSRVTNNEDKTMQSTHEMEIRNRDESLAYLLENSEWDKSKDALSNNLQLKYSFQQFLLKHSNESFSNIENQMKADEKNMFTNMTLTMYKTQQLNDIAHKQLYGFMNLKNRTEIVNNYSSQNICQKLFENLRLLSFFKSCDFNTKEIRSFQRFKSAVNMQSFDKWKKERDILWKRNLKTQVAIALKTFVDLEMMKIDLENRRRSVYKLAIQVVKLSTYIRSIHKFLVKKENMNKVRIHEDNIKAQGFF